MKNRKSVIVFLLIITVIVVSSIYVFKRDEGSARNPSVVEHSGTPGTFQTDTLGALIGITSYKPLLDYMPDANARPDLDKCPMNSPVQARWETTQARSLDDVLSTYAEEYEESLRESEAKGDSSYFKTDAEQLAAVKRMKAMRVAGVIEYNSLSGELCAIVLLYLPSETLHLSPMVLRDSKWRLLMGYLPIGTDLKYVLAALDNYLSSKNDIHSLLDDAKSIRSIIQKAVKTAVDEERSAWLVADREKINDEWASAKVTQAADECRVLMLKYPRSKLVKKFRARFEVANRILTHRGIEPLIPFRNVKELADYRQKQVDDALKRTGGNGNGH